MSVLDGRYYEYIDELMTMAEALQFSRSSTYSGVIGHLLVTTSTAEETLLIGVAVFVCGV